MTVAIVITITAAIAGPAGFLLGCFAGWEFRSARDQLLARIDRLIRAHATEGDDWRVPED